MRRTSLGTLNSTNDTSFGSDSGGNTITINSMKKSIAEKDKHIAFLEKKLCLSESTVKLLQENEQKMKLAERSARIQLSANQSMAKRTSIQLMQATEHASKMNASERNRFRITLLKREELEAELNAAEDLLQNTKEDYERRISAIEETHRIEVDILSSRSASKRPSKNESSISVTDDVSLSGDQGSKENHSNNRRESADGRATLSIRLGKLLTETDEKQRSLADTCAALEKQLRDAVADNEARISKKDEQLESMREEMAVLKDELTQELQELSSAKEKEIQDLTKAFNHRVAAMETKAAVEEKSRATERFDEELSRREAAAEAKLCAVQRELQLRTDSLQLRIVALETERSSFANSLDEAYKTNEMLTGEILRLKTQLESDAATCTARISQLESELTAAISSGVDSVQIEELQARVDKLMTEAAEKALQLSLSAAKNFTMEKEMVTLRSQLKSAESVVAATALEEQRLRETSHLTMEQRLKLKSIEVKELAVKLATLSDAFEVTRGITPVLNTFTPVSTSSLEDLKMLLTRSDAELIKRASKNASLQHEVNRLNEVLTQFDWRKNEEAYTAAVEEADRLRRELQQAYSKLEQKCQD